MVVSNGNNDTYMLRRDLTKESSGAFIYLSWHKIIATKSQCHPSPSDIKVAQTLAEINLLALLTLVSLAIDFCRLTWQIKFFSAIFDPPFWIFEFSNFNQKPEKHIYIQESSTFEILLIEICEMILLFKRRFSDLLMNVKIVLFIFS